MKWLMKISPRGRRISQRMRQKSRQEEWMQRQIHKAILSTGGGKKEMRNE